MKKRSKKIHKTYIFGMAAGGNRLGDRARSFMSLGVKSLPLFFTSKAIPVSSRVSLLFIVFCFFVVCFICFKLVPAGNTTKPKNQPSHLAITWPSPNRGQMTNLA
jgi:hypothetical protein